MTPDDATSLSPLLSTGASTGADQTAAPDASASYASAAQSGAAQSGGGQKCDGSVGDDHAPDAYLQPPDCRHACISGRTFPIGAPPPFRLMMDHA